MVQCSLCTCTLCTVPPDRTANLRVDALLDKGLCCLQELASQQHHRSCTVTHLQRQGSEAVIVHKDFLGAPLSGQGTIE
jgi:hypothetical protein